MKEEYDKYTVEDHKVWSILWDRQAAFLPGNSTDNFIEGIDKVGFVRDRIPDFKEVEGKLQQLTGWAIEVVPRLIDDKDFF